MSEFRARIGRVRMKNGGASLTVIEGRKQTEEGTCEGTLLSTAREASERGQMEAFVLLTIHDGSAYFSHRVEQDCGFPRSLIPEYAAEMIRRYALNQHDCRLVFNEMFTWVDGRQ